MVSLRFTAKMRLFLKQILSYSQVVKHFKFKFLLKWIIIGPQDYFDLLMIYFTDGYTIHVSIY